MIRTLRVTALLAIGLTGQTQVAAAQTSCPAAEIGASTGEMIFSVRNRPGESPVLVAEGVIDRNVLPRLRAALENFEGNEFWLRSPGGFAGVDHRAGYLIRQRGLTTRVPSDWICRGACVFMFLGGQQRSVDDGGALVVDMFEHDDVSDLGEVERSSRMLATQDYDFLIRMGIRPALLSDIMYRQSAQATREVARCLTRRELDDYRVVTTPGPRSG
jgi:hypothetical protein